MAARAAGDAAADAGKVNDTCAEALFAAFGGSIPRPRINEFVEATNKWSVAVYYAKKWKRAEETSLATVASMLHPLAQGGTEPSGAVVAAIQTFVLPLLPKIHRDSFAEWDKAKASGHLRNSDSTLYSVLCESATKARRRLANRLLAAVWPHSRFAVQVAAELDRDRIVKAGKLAAEKAVAGSDNTGHTLSASSAGGSLLRGGECVTACESATTQFAVLRRHSSSCARVESRCRAECLSGGRRQRRQR